MSGSGMSRPKLGAQLRLGRERSPDGVVGQLRDIHTFIDKAFVKHVEPSLEEKSSWAGARTHGRWEVGLGPRAGCIKRPRDIDGRVAFGTLVDDVDTPVGYDCRRRSAGEDRRGKRLLGPGCCRRRSQRGERGNAVPVNGGRRHAVEVHRRAGEEVGARQNHECIAGWVAAGGIDRPQGRRLEEGEVDIGDVEEDVARAGDADARLSRRPVWKGSPARCRRWLCWPRGLSGR